MTLHHDVHDWFDRLQLWFEKTVRIKQYSLDRRNKSTTTQTVKNRYKINCTDELFTPPEEVTFTTPDDKNLPVPSEELLALHAACAKVAHFSGAAEYIDESDRDVESLGVLAHNGSSAEVLRSAILNRMNQIVDVGA
jgi:hypothetical protein